MHEALPPELFTAEEMLWHFNGKKNTRLMVLSQI
jgi:hypothetical protein